MNIRGMSSLTPRQVKCPQCGKMTVYSLENPSRPFCSERCRLIDLGAWADENYKIPTRNSSSDALTDEESDPSNQDPNQDPNQDSDHDDDMKN